MCAIVLEIGNFEGIFEAIRYRVRTVLVVNIISFRKLSKFFLYQLPVPNIFICKFIPMYSIVPTNFSYIGLFKIAKLEELFKF